MVFCALKVRMAFQGLQSFTSPSTSRSSAALFLPPHGAPATPVFSLLPDHAKVVPTLGPSNSAWISLPQNLTELMVQVRMLCAGSKKKTLLSEAVLSSRGRPAGGGYWRCFRGRLSAVPSLPHGQRRRRRTRKGLCQWYLSVFSGKQKLPQDTHFRPPASTTISLARAVYVAPS